MGEFTNRRAGQAVPASAVVSPVDAAQLEAWLGLPSTDPNSALLLSSATSAVIGYIGRDLLTREWVLTHWDWPVWGTMTPRSLGAQVGDFAREITLPYGPAQSVESVTSYGEPLTEFTERDDAIVTFGVGRNGLNEFPALVIEYTAGFGDTAADVPDAIKQAILQLAAFQYEHRGSCDAIMAMQKSGAAELLTPWRKAELLL